MSPYRKSQLIALGACKSKLIDARAELRYWKWALLSRLGRHTSLATSAKLTVIIPACSPRRSRNVGPMVSHLLSCDFVGKVIVSLNNPQIDLSRRLKMSVPRLMVIKHTRRRGPGVSWFIASAETAEYFMLVDDDILLYPRQVATLFTRLLTEPGTPHGFCGVDGTRYVHNEEGEVDTLYEVYAVTRAHVLKYVEYAARIAAAGAISPLAIEFWADDVVLSRTGQGRPKTHDIGPVSRCRTYDKRGVALHREPEFDARRQEVLDAVVKILH